jgi:hypothetical protein
LEVVPSLQVTVVPELLELDELEAAAGALAAAGASAGVALPDEADLLTPPWPLHAPRPPFEVVPSLQVTVVPELVACAIAPTGAPSRAIEAAAPQMKPQSFATFMWNTPRTNRVVVEGSEYSKDPCVALEACALQRIAGRADSVGSAPHEPA